MSLTKSQKYFWIIIAVYFAAWFPLLINYDGVYWDDWTIFNQGRDELIADTEARGRVISFYLHSFLQSIGNGILSFRLLTFFSYLAISLSIYYLAKPKKICGELIAFYLALLVATFPVNTARISTVCVDYGFTVALFFLAFLIVVHKRRYLKYRALSLLLFFISFTTESLLVFYFFPMVYLFFISEGNYIKDQKIILILNQLKIFIIKNVDFMMLPFVFFLIKSIYFTPYGTHENYNSINIPWQTIPFFISILGIIYFAFFLIKDKGLALKKNILLIAMGFILFLLALFPYYAAGRLPWIHSMHNGWPVILSTIVAFIILLNTNIYLVIFKIKDKNYSLKTVLIYLTIVSILFLAAVLPNYVADKFEWESRHFELIPYGLSIIFIYSINNFFKKNVVHFVLSSCIVLFVLFHLNHLKDFQIDSFKQDAIMVQIKTIDEVKNSKNKIILFNDETLNYNALGRSYRIYEWSGMLKKVYGDTARFGITENDFKGQLLDISLLPKQYNFYDYKGDKKTVAGTLHIKKTNHLFTFRAIIELLYLKIFKRNQYEMKVINYINVSYISLKS